MARAIPSNVETRSDASTPRSLAREPSGSAIRGDALRVRVDVAAIVADEADERLAEAFGGLDREARRRRYRAEDRDARDRGLLDELEAQPSRNHEHALGQRQSPRENRLTD